MTGVLVSIGILLSLPGALTAVHLAALTLASLFYRDPHPRDVARLQLRFLVLIPAHNEEAVLGDALAAVRRLKRSGDTILVVDDRSTDRTSEIAREHGALVLRRSPEQPPGRAAARDAGLRHALTLDWDAIAMIDADSVIEPGYFEACEAVLASGADALQARSEAWLGRGVLAHLFLAAFAMQGVTLPRGRDRLGLVVWLRGTGMVFRRWIAQQHGFRGPGASEDGFFTLDLWRDGIRARHCDAARLRSRSAGSLRTASGQRARWEAGRILLAQEFFSALLKRRNLPSLEAAIHLVTPPFALAVLSLILGAIVFALVGSTPLLLACLFLLSLLALTLVISLVQARAAPLTWVALLTAPFYVLWKVPVQARAIALVFRRKRDFAPTVRD